MGACASCLGLGRRPSDSEVSTALAWLSCRLLTQSPPLQRSDSSHLLADPYQPHYGSINPPGSHSVPQPDPEEIRRQRDALERICAQTSE